MDASGFVIRVLLLAWANGVGAVAAHEAGHALTALTLGVGIREICVCKLRLILDGNGPILSLSGPDPNTLGHVTLAPPRTAGLRWRLVAIYAAGPVAEIALYLAVFVVALAAGLGVTYPGLFLVAGLARYFPHVREQGLAAFGDDGRWLRVCLNGGQAAERLCAETLLHGQARDGLRPRDWDSGAIACCTTPLDGSSDELQGCLFGYYHALDRGDPDAAGSLLDRVVELAGQYLSAQYDCWLEGAYFEAYARRDARRARQLFEAALDSDLRRAELNTATSWDGCSPRLRAELAVLVAEGRHTQAQRLADAALAHARALTLPTKHVRASLITELEWIREVLRPLGAVPAVQAGVQQRHTALLVAAG